MTPKFFGMNHSEVGVQGVDPREGEESPGKVVPTKVLPDKNAAQLFQGICLDCHKKMSM